MDGAFFFEPLDLLVGVFFLTTTAFFGILDSLQAVSTARTHLLGVVQQARPVQLDRHVAAR